MIRKRVGNHVTLIPCGNHVLTLCTNKADTELD